MFAQCFVFIVLCAFSLTWANDDLSLHRFRGHILKINENFEIVTSLADSYQEPDIHVDNVVASGSWNQSYNITGWSVLEIKTSENQTNIDQVYSAGLLEGRFTQALTTMTWQNNVADVCSDHTHFCEKLKKFFLTQLDWIYQQIDTNPTDEYWHQVNLTLIQLNGIIDGYENKSRGPRKELDDPLGFFLFQVLNSLDDIASSLGLQNISRHDHCSVLIKILPDFKNIFVSHVTWDDYSNLLKILKRYTMPLKRTPAANSTLIPGSDMIFSSYAGTLHSSDDFYMTFPANLTVVETTLDIYKDHLYRNINPISVPEWIRVTIATRLANSGKEWVDQFYKFNDGTYNNEWMITDFKLFQPGTPPKPGFLTVTEQITTYSESADMTEILNNNSYWASYNNIYFPDFRNISGEEEMVKKKGPELYSWQNSSRAKIFQRDHNKVIDLPTMIHMMRYNDFKNDELSKCSCTPPYSSTLTISARCDLNDKKGKYPDDDLGFDCSGATDAKITSYEMMKDFSLVAIAGPTSDQQPPFIWSQSHCDKKVSHIGNPDKWDFKPFVPTWNLS